MSIQTKTKRLTTRDIQALQTRRREDRHADGL